VVIQFRFVLAGFGIVLALIFARVVSLPRGDGLGVPD
jgi:hypothetical protein